MGNCLAKQDNEFPDFSGEKDARKRQKIHKKRLTLLKKQGRRVRKLFERCIGETEKLNRLSPQTRVFKFRSLERRVEDRLAKLGLRMVKVSDDGNCFFRAAPYHMHYPQENLQLKSLTSNSNLHEFHIFMTTEDADPITQLEDLLVEGSWCNSMADALPLALSRLTSRNVLIVSSHAENPTTVLESTTEPTARSASSKTEFQRERPESANGYGKYTSPPIVSDILLACGLLDKTTSQDETCTKCLCPDPCQEDQRHENLF
ncbi:hypothetical protein Bbelb_269510 [Branchiostoma belcheri]|nr:hypothetical protein Bbelb_269510 [Branchiostoma belcheri]